MKYWLEVGSWYPDSKLGAGNSSNEFSLDRYFIRCKGRLHGLYMLQQVAGHKIASLSTFSTSGSRLKF